MHYLISAAETHASTDETRDYLRYVRVDPDHVWATDGHRACVLKNSCALDSGAYLAGSRVADAPDGPPFLQVIPSPDVPVLLTLEPGHIAELRDLVACLQKSTVAILYTYTAEDSFKVCLTRTVGSKKKERTHKAEFLLSGKRASVQTGICIEYLLDAIDALWGAVVPESIVLRQKDPLDAIRIDSPSGLAIVMPCRA